MEVSVKKPGTPGDILEHHGIKGMKWGVHRERASSGGKAIAGRVSSAGKAAGRGAGRVGKGLGAAIDNTQFELMGQTSTVHHMITSNAAERFGKSLPGIKAKHGDYGKLRNRIRRPFSPEAKAYRADVKKSYLRALEKSANEMTNIRGTRRYTLKEKGKPNTSQYTWRVSTESITHDAVSGTFVVRPIFDDEGWIIGIENVDDMEQSMELGVDFLLHMGIEV